MDTLIEDAIAFAGSEAKLGDGTGFSQVAINKAKHAGRTSPRMALAIHRFTNGKISASKLRPDLWPTEQHIPDNPADRVSA